MMAASALCIGMTASSVASANTLTDHAPRVVEAPMSTAPRRTRAQAGGTRFYHSRYCCAVKTNPREKFRRINILWRKDYHCRLAFYVVMICRRTKQAQLLVFPLCFFFGSPNMSDNHLVGLFQCWWFTIVKSKSVVLWQGNQTDHRVSRKFK
jgi:hypothetical protein